MYALVDCNNFFVSCERVFRPQLEGRPVVVLSNNDGCVVSRSNESKALGIKMCTPFYQIRHLVDNGTVAACSSNYALYGDLSSRVMSILADSVPKIEIYSIDEAFLVLDGISSEKIEGLCLDIIYKIRKWVGIPVSIGVAQTKTLAKIASHFAKTYRGYQGLCMIDTEQKRLKALALTPIQEVWGIGRRLSVKMSEAGIKTALDYVGRPPEWIDRHFMLHGMKTWHELNGTVSVEEERPDKRKSICTSRSFSDMVTDERELSLRIADFAAICARKLRKEHSVAEDVTVFLHTNRFRDDLPQYYPSATVHLPVAANSSQEITAAALKGLHAIYRDDYRYKKAGVIVDSLTDESTVQIPMFDYDPGLRQKNDRISRIMDSVNASGKNLLHLASQRSGHFSEGVRSDFRSRAFSTSWDDILDIR